MTRDEITKMARDCGWAKVGREMEYPVLTARLERFAGLVEQHLISQGYRKCAKGQRTTQYCGLLEDAVQAEREACAKVCDHMKNDIYNNSQEDTQPMAHAVANFCAEAIRERGEQLREALKTYGQHRNNCAAVLGGYQCTCGFNQQEQTR